MDELVLLIVGATITGFTQIIKRYTNVNPLVIAAAISLLAGLVFAGLSTLGYWESIKSFMLLAWPVSVTLYQLFKQALR